MITMTHFLSVDIAQVMVVIVGANIIYMIVNISKVIATNTIARFFFANIVELNYPKSKLRRRKTKTKNRYARSV